jgi:hypothetical protein
MSGNLDDAFEEVPVFKAEIPLVEFNLGLQMLKEGIGWGLVSIGLSSRSHGCREVRSMRSTYKVDLHSKSKKEGVGGLMNRGRCTASGNLSALAGHARLTGETCGAE